jgi:pimeloyl-ACP methyl ester carboxylesterase
VVLIAPAIASPEADARSYQKRYGKELAPLLAKARALVAAGQGGTMMAPTDFIYCPQATVSAASFVSYYGDDPRKDTPRNLAAIEKPLLVVAATEDSIVTGLGPLVQPLADGEKLTYVEIEDAGHFFLDFYAEDLADAMAEFIAGPES